MGGAHLFVLTVSLEEMARRSKATESHVQGNTHILSPAFSNTNSSSRLDLLTTLRICSQTSEDCNTTHALAAPHTCHQARVTVTAFATL